MDYEQKINSIQWEALIEAIGNGGGAGGPGAWQKVASNITEIPWASLNCDEILCIVKQTIGQKPAAAFILPYSAMGENVPIVDGNYYNANYYYSFGIQSGNTNLYVNPSWCRGYESGTVISGSNFVMDVYVRKGASGGSGEFQKIYRDSSFNRKVYGNQWEDVFEYTVNIPSDGIYAVNGYFQKIRGVFEGICSLRLLVDGQEASNENNVNASRVSVMINTSLYTGMQTHNFLSLTTGQHTFKLQIYSSAETDGDAISTLEIYK